MTGPAPAATARSSWWTGARWVALALVALMVMLALRLLRATWRVTERGQPPGGRSLVAFWHGDQVALTACALRPVVLVSRSRDGEIGALAARMLGYQVVRGSTSQGAVAGALGLARTLRRGGEAALAADGPRGPRHRAASSAGRLASMAGASLIPVGVAVSRSWRLSSWDQMTIPAPFAAVAVTWGAAVTDEALQQGLEAARREAGEGLQMTAGAPVSDEHEAETRP